MSALYTALSELRAALVAMTASMDAIGMAVGLPDEGHDHPHVRQVTISELRSLRARLAAMTAERATLQLENDAWKDAGETALDEIAALCGCPEWDYPGQVIRDVQALKAQLAAMTAEREAERDRTRVFADRLVEAGAAQRNLSDQLAAMTAERDGLRANESVALSCPDVAPADVNYMLAWLATTPGAEASNAVRFILAKRAQLAAMTAERNRLTVFAEAQTRDVDRLNRVIGQSLKDWGELRAELAAMTKARDKACALGRRYAGLECDSAGENRFDELLRVGA